LGIDRFVSLALENPLCYFGYHQKAEKSRRDNSHQFVNQFVTLSESARSGSLYSPATTFPLLMSWAFETR